MKVNILQKLTQEDVAFFEAMIRHEAVRPGVMFPASLGPNAARLNAAMYDQFQGNGYQLNLLTGAFEEKKP